MFIISNSIYHTTLKAKGTRQWYSSQFEKSNYRLSSGSREELMLILSVSHFFSKILNLHQVKLTPAFFFSVCEVNKRQDLSFWICGSVLESVGRTDFCYYSAVQACGYFPWEFTESIHFGCWGGLEWALRPGGVVFSGNKTTNSQRSCWCSFSASTHLSYLLDALARKRPSS